MTAAQRHTIDHRRIDDTARDMMRHGVGMDWAESDEIGQEGHQWLRDRLALGGESHDWGMAYRPAVRCDGCAACQDEDEVQS